MARVESVKRVDTEIVATLPQFEKSARTPICRCLHFGQVKTWVPVNLLPPTKRHGFKNINSEADC
jgi:hypothetical protein